MYDSYVKKEESTSELLPRVNTNQQKSVSKWTLNFNMAEVNFWLRMSGSLKFPSLVSCKHEFYHLSGVVLHVLLV